MSFGSLNPKRGLVAALAAGALAIPACGSDDEGPAPPGQAPAVTDAPDAPAAARSADEPAADPATDRQKIGATLDAIMTSADEVAACSAFVTERYVRRAFGDLTGCIRAQESAKPAKRVRVSRVVVSPEAVAQASVVAVGGVYDGERLRAELVLDGDVWKLDALRSNVPVGP